MSPGKSGATSRRLAVEGQAGRIRLSYCANLRGRIGSTNSQHRCFVGPERISHAQQEQSAWRYDQQKISFPSFCFLTAYWTPSSSIGLHENAEKDPRSCFERRGPGYKAPMFSGPWTGCTALTAVDLDCPGAHFLGGARTPLKMFPQTSRRPRTSRIHPFTDSESAVVAPPASGSCDTGGVLVYAGGILTVRVYVWGNKRASRYRMSTTADCELPLTGEGQEDIASDVRTCTSICISSQEARRVWLHSPRRSNFDSLGVAVHVSTARLSYWRRSPPAVGIQY